LSQFGFVRGKLLFPKPETSGFDVQSGIPNQPCSTNLRCGNQHETFLALTTANMKHIGYKKEIIFDDISKWFLSLHYVLRM
jgi:hypothetical protein